MSNFTRKIKQFIHQESTHELNGEALENLTTKLEFFKCLKPVLIINKATLQWLLIEALQGRKRQKLSRQQTFCQKVFGTKTFQVKSA